MTNMEPPNLAPLPSNDSNTTPAEKTSADGWWRTQSATLALLKHAYHLLGASERRLAEQDRRIRELEDLAATDPLTGLMNRRGFEKFFNMELARIHRKHSPGALLILIDLDLFKPVNDTYGHMAGDACLQALGRKMLQSIRMLDGAARIGGDEFAILLTQLPPEAASGHLEKIRVLLAETTLDCQGKKITFSASIGTATVTEDSLFTSVYDAADAVLYADKKQRRSRAG